MLQTKVVEKIKVHFVFNIFSPENLAVYEIMWKNSVERGKLHVNMAHAHCLLDT